MSSPPATRTTPPPARRSAVGLPENDEWLSNTDGQAAPSGLAAMAVEELEAENAEEICCYTCGKTPCELLEFGTPALHAIEQKFNVETAIEKGYVVEVETGKKFPNNRIRFSFYKMFAYEKFGHL